MAVIVEEITIEAAPQRVWGTITRQDEITQWWADKAQFKPEVGSLAEFRFRPPAGALQFEVTELEQGKKMHWICRQGPPPWVGTSVTWQLTPAHNGTTLVFTHEGFTQVDGRYAQIRRNWKYFLDSLKSYLETGQGTPGLPPSVS